MKIQLEKKSSYCPDHMTCVACGHNFKVDSLRRLLIDDHAMIQGDLCHSCFHRSTPSLQRLLKAQGTRLLTSSNSPTQARGQELLTIATEPARFPSVWEWLSKKNEILVAETTALEQARLNLSTCHCRQIEKLEHLYQTSDQYDGFNKIDQ